MRQQNTSNNERVLRQLAGSGDAKELMSLLKRQGGVQQAAQAAAQGRPEELMVLLERLTGTQEGAQLVERLRRQAYQSVLKIARAG